MMLKVESRTSEFVRISAPEGISTLVWDRIRGFFPNHRPEGNGTSRSVLVPFHEFVTQRPVLSAYCEANEIIIAEEPTISERLSRFDRSKSDGRSFSESELSHNLLAAGFTRELMTFQTRNVLKMCKAMQGASFSVPGAGKTTEALAFYFALRDEADALLVVAPKTLFAHGRSNSMNARKDKTGFSSV